MHLYNTTILSPRWKLFAMPMTFYTLYLCNANLVHILQVFAQHQKCSFALFCRLKSWRSRRELIKMKNKTTYMLYKLQETCLEILAGKSTIQNISCFLQKYRYLRYFVKPSLIRCTCSSILDARTARAQKKFYW